MRFTDKEWFTDKKRMIWIGAGCLACAVVILVIVLICSIERIGPALKEKNFAQVQVTITSDVVSLDAALEESEDETAEDDTEKSENEDKSELIVKKDGDIVYESGYEEYYRYEKDGQKMVCYNTNPNVSDSESGIWVEARATDSSFIENFDFSVFQHYESDDFKRRDGYFIPRTNVEEMFFEFLLISDKELYSDCDIKFLVEDGKITKMLASYIYGNTWSVEREYQFTYEDEKIVLPVITKED